MGLIALDDALVHHLPRLFLHLRGGVSRCIFVEQFAEIAHKDEPHGFVAHIVADDESSVEGLVRLCIVVVEEPKHASHVVDGAQAKLCVVGGHAFTVSFADDGKAGHGLIRLVVSIVFPSQA